MFFSFRMLVTLQKERFTPNLTRRSMSSSSWQITSGVWRSQTAVPLDTSWIWSTSCDPLSRSSHTSRWVPSTDQPPTHQTTTFLQLNIVVSYFLKTCFVLLLNHMWVLLFLIWRRGVKNPFETFFPHISQLLAYLFPTRLLHAFWNAGTLFTNHRANSKFEPSVSESVLLWLGACWLGFWQLLPNMTHLLISKCEGYPKSSASVWISCLFSFPFSDFVWNDCQWIDLFISSPVSPLTPSVINSCIFHFFYQQFFSSINLTCQACNISLAEFTSSCPFIVGTFLFLSFPSFPPPPPFLVGLGVSLLRITTMTMHRCRWVFLPGCYITILPSCRQSGDEKHALVWLLQACLFPLETVLDGRPKDRSWAMKRFLRGE